MLNWDDLRVVAAIREAGSYAGAAERLRLDETTVARRLGRLQKELGVSLFEAADGLRRPTPACEAMLSHIRDMARHVAAIGDLAAGGPDLRGRFRLAATASVAEEVLAPAAAAFLARHPGITLDFRSSSRNLDINRWETDLAIRLGRPDKGNFDCLKLADIPLCLVEPAERREGEGAPFSCVYPAELEGLPEMRQLRRMGLAGQGRCVTDSLRMIKTLVASGRCIGILPAFLCADLAAGREWRLTPLPEGREAWLLIQPHLKRDPAARAVIDWIREAFAARMG